MDAGLFSLADGATEVLLIRHADAAAPAVAADAQAAPYCDLPLCDRGRRQARALAARLARAQIATIYSSPVRRAQETAQTLSRRLRRAIAYDERLREVEIAGLDEPRHPAEFGAHLERLAALAMTAGGWSSVPGSEPSHAVRGRMREAIENIAAGHPGKRVVAVTHAGTINAYVADLLGLDSDFFFPAANASITVVRLHRNRRLLVALNDVAHLDGPAL